MIEFPSAVEALSAAIGIQQAMLDANRDQPADTAIVFRIGLDFGDFIVDDNELYGDPLACWIETEIGLAEGEKLRRRPPMTLSDATSKLAAQTKIPSEECRSALAGMLSLMACSL